MKQRIIKMSEVVEDPLEPPRFKHRNPVIESPLPLFNPPLTPSQM